MLTSLESSISKATLEAKTQPEPKYSICCDRLVKRLPNPNTVSQHPLSRNNAKEVLLPLVPSFYPHRPLYGAKSFPFHSGGVLHKEQFVISTKQLSPRAVLTNTLCYRVLGHLFEATVPKPCVPISLPGTEQCEFVWTGDRAGETERLGDPLSTQ
jgi:hypothetical protein